MLRGVIQDSAGNIDLYSCSAPSNLTWRCCWNVSPSHGKHETLASAFLQIRGWHETCGAFDAETQRAHPATHSAHTHRLSRPPAVRILTHLCSAGFLVGDSEGKLVIVSTSTSLTPLTNPTYFELDRLIDQPSRIGAVGGFAILKADQADLLSYLLLHHPVSEALLHTLESRIANRWLVTCSKHYFAFASLRS